MAEIVDVIETRIVADFRTDDLLKDYLPRVSDHHGMKGDDDPAVPARDEKPFAITVIAEDRGDFPQVPGSGIKLVGVEVEILVNEGGPDADPKLLGRLAACVSGRLQTGRENELSSPALKIYGIMAKEPERRSELDLTRERVIARELVAVQIG